MSAVQRNALTRLDVARGLRLSIWEGIWATVFMVLTTGAFQTGFALYLGASPFVLGLLAGLPAAAGLLQIPASLYVDRRGERRIFCTLSSFPGRLVWLPILLIPFVLPDSLRLGAFVVLLTLSSGLLTITAPAWTSWMSDLVPADSRGRYFGRRNMLAGIVTALVPLPAGAFLDQAVKYGRFDPRLGFAVLFGVACLAAAVAAWFLVRTPEPPMAARESRGNPFRSLSVPLSDRNFRRFLIFAGTFMGGQAIAGQFFIAWQVDRQALNLPYLTVQVLGAAASGAGLASMPLWGYLSDKYGSRPVLALCAAGASVPPFLWLLTFPHPSAFWLNVAVIVVLNVLSGAFWAGYGLTQFNLLIGVAPAESRGTYVAVFSAVTGVLGGIAPIAGGALMTLLESAAVPLGALVLNNYKLLFILSGLLRFTGVLLLQQVTEAESHSTRYVLDQLRTARPVSSWRTLRRLARPSREAERREAVEQLGDLRSPLAVEELAVALDDVSPAVRENAVRALGRIKDARAIPALVAKLNDPAAQLGDLAAEALGEIGDRTAVQPLIEATEGPDGTVRFAALRALGRLADERALPALLASLEPGHPTTCEAACEAIAAIGARVSPPDAAHAYDRLFPLLGEQPRGIRLAAARAVEALAPRLATVEGYDRLAQCLAEETDPAVAAQEAAALSWFRGGEAHPAAARTALLLPVLDRAAMSPLAYRQAVAAVARVPFPDDSFYRYLSLPEMVRDETASKLLDEIRRRLRGAEGDGNLRGDRRATQALEAFTLGDYADCLRHLERLGRGLPHDREPAKSCIAVLEALAHRAVERASRGPEMTAARPEEALLGIVLLRTALQIPVSTGATRPTG